MFSCDAVLIGSVQLTAFTKTDRDLREDWDGRKSGRQETAGRGVAVKLIPCSFRHDWNRGAVLVQVRDHVGPNFVCGFVWIT
jgi:hypothetical protein